jgi:transcriptional antiterminator NusG
VPFRLRAGRERHKTNRPLDINIVSAGSGSKLLRLFRSLSKLQVNPVDPIGPGPFLEAELGMTMTNDEHWYAVYTKSRFEQKVFQALNDKSIPAFLPRIETLSRRQDRKKKIWLPLFPGYVFFRSPWDLKLYWEVLKTDGVVKALTMGGEPAQVPEVEIQSVKIVVESLLPLSPHPFIREGDRVIIEGGPLKGAQGIFISREGKSGKFVVGVDLLNRAVAVEIEPEFIRKL